MSDRELLELAAKAAGLKKDDSPYNGGGAGNNGFSITGDMVLDWHNNKRWNPITDDGDALRLAVKLRLTVETDICFAEVPYEMQCEATRRAIVRAAAEIGKAMKS